MSWGRTTLAFTFAMRTRVITAGSAASAWRTAATGIVSELVITYVVADTIDRLPDLEDTIATLLLRLVALPTPD